MTQKTDGTADSNKPSQAKSSQQPIEVLLTVRAGNNHAQTGVEVTLASYADKPCLSVKSLADVGKKLAKLVEFAQVHPVGKPLIEPLDRLSATVDMLKTGTLELIQATEIPSKTPTGEMHLILTIKPKQ